MDIGVRGEKLRGSELLVEVAGLLREKGIGREVIKRAFKEGRMAEKGKLPPEVMEMVKGYFGEALPMTREKAEGHRLELMKGRMGFQEKAREDRVEKTYNFCEH
ncbi:hypothetical protein B0T14DRAFT_570829 [Immersiella caudata]|uniref:Uncharacterized protein n=1 Tax=Immersiella caudata TaxID=314043 RepID=A0AA39W489_9PEZI|nr:hypothetical protein B0T14DRAFT_570829 [Immersiella caudata]